MIYIRCLRDKSFKNWQDPVQSAAGSPWQFQYKV